MVTVYVVDTDDIPAGEIPKFIYDPHSSIFDAERFKKIACIRMDIRKFVKKFNDGSLDIDDQNCYIYLEI